MTQMTHWSLSASTAIALVLSAGSALAITPEEVWANWQALATEGGGTLTAASQTKTGAALELTGVVQTTTTPEVTIHVAMDKVTLTDKGDGTVQIVTSDSYPLSVIEPGKTPDQAAAVITFSQPGGSWVASGTPEAVTWDFSYPTVTATLTKAQEDGKPLDVKGTMTLTDLSGTITTGAQADKPVAMKYALNIGSLALSADGRNPSANEEFAVTVGLSDLVASATGTVLPQAQMVNMAEALKAGFAVDSSSSTGALKVDVKWSDNAGPNAFGLELGGTSTKVKLDATAIDYGFGLMAGKFNANAPGGGMPPVDGSFSEIGLSVAMPVSKTDAPQPFAFVTRLVDVAVSDTIWGMIDPGAQLPHDPATLILDLKGTGAWAVDILDPAIQNGSVPMPDMPATLNTLDLTQLLLKIVGGEITGTGALTFDNSDLVTFGGIPAPEGKLNFTLKGINALIDKAVAMGFLPEDQVMGVRMGLAMFAKPGAGPDELTSEVEFKNKGLFVNGQQLQ